MVHGDRRNYLTALITLDREEVERFAAARKIDAASWEELARHPAVRALVEAQVREANQQLAKYETIKKIEILAEDFTEASGELTPTLKIRRREIAKRYQQLLDSMYDKQA